MTDLLDLDADPPPARRRRRRRGGRASPAPLAVLVVLALVGGARRAAGLAVARGLFGSSAAEDYPGPGSGEVDGADRAR